MVSPAVRGIRLPDTELLRAADVLPHGCLGDGAPGWVRTRSGLRDTAGGGIGRGGDGDVRAGVGSLAARTGSTPDGSECGVRPVRAADQPVRRGRRTARAWLGLDGLAADRNPRIVATGPQTGMVPAPGMVGHVFHCCPVISHTRGVGASRWHPRSRVGSSVVPASP